MVALTSPLAAAAAAADGGTMSVAFSMLEPTVCNKLVALCTCAGRNSRHACFLDSS